MFRTVFLLIATAGAGLTLGCASPGVPRPPSLDLPSPAKKVEAQRVGDEVRLTWSSPEKTTDGARIKGAMTAVICREMPPVKGCAEVARIPARAGESAAVDRLAGGVAEGPARLLAYRVELLNEKMRSAGPSDAAFVVGGAAPAAVGPLTLQAQREAVLVRWKVAASGSTMELKRTLVATAAGPVEAKVDSQSRTNGGMQLGAKKEPAGMVTLRAEGVKLGGALGPDPGGLVDGTVRDGDTYSYVAQRVRVVTLGGQELEVRGEASPAARIEYKDVFPPRAPVGLVSVPGGGFGSVPSVDLSWEPNAETDVVGYNVYRREGASGEFVKLNGAPVAESAYRDLKAMAGHAYTYRVTAVDARHQEGKPSDEVHESLRQ